MTVTYFQHILGEFVWFDDLLSFVCPISCILRQTSFHAEHFSWFLVIFTNTFPAVLSLYNIFNNRPYKISKLSKLSVNLKKQWLNIHPHAYYSLVCFKMKKHSDLLRQWNISCFPQRSCPCKCHHHCPLAWICVYLIQFWIGGNSEIHICPGWN